MPGTSPDYWMSADDRLTATMLDIIDTRNAKAAKASKSKGGGRRGR